MEITIPSCSPALAEAVLRAIIWTERPRSLTHFNELLAEGRRVTFDSEGGIRQG